MVSTRGLKFKFGVGEKVLCYEPDPTKKKVLYDSKVMAIFEEKDRRGKKTKIEYLIHFQGWSSSWDRRVCEEFVLKDADENRRLQKELADKAQLQIGTYLYRKERNKRSREMSSGSGSDSKAKIQKISEANSLFHNSVPTSIIGQNDSFVEQLLKIKQEPGIEPCTNSVDNENTRLFLHIGQKLKNFLEFDCAMITKMEKLVNLPAQIPVVTILESFVKHISIKALNCPTPVHTLRKRNNNKADKREKDFQKLVNSINLRKEVADGLRLFFDFTLKNNLLYKNEMEQANTLLSDDYLKNFTYIPSNRQFLDSLTIKQDTLGTPLGSEMSEPVQINNVEMFDESRYIGKRKLRSHKKLETEFMYEIGMTRPSSALDGKCVSSNYDTIPNTSNFGRNVASQSSKSKEILNSVLSWQLLQSDAPPKPSMIYGAIHLARLLVKLPEFFNGSAISDAKLKVLISHLDIFTEFIETHKEWFSASNYRDASMICSSPNYDTKENIIRVELNENHVFADRKIKIES